MGLGKALSKAGEILESGLEKTSEKLSERFPYFAEAVRRIPQNFRGVIWDSKEWQYTVLDDILDVGLEILVIPVSFTEDYIRIRKNKGPIKIYGYEHNEKIMDLVNNKSPLNLFG